MSKFCPIVNRKVTYQFCQDCDDKICRKQEIKKNKDNQERKGVVK